MRYVHPVGMFVYGWIRGGMYPPYIDVGITDIHGISSLSYLYNICAMSRSMCIYILVFVRE